MKTDKIPLMLRLDEALHQKLKCVSENERRSLNSQIEHFIAAGIAEYEKLNGSITLSE